MEPLTFADLARLARLEDRAAAAAELRAAFEQDRIWRISLFSVPSPAPKIRTGKGSSEWRTACANVGTTCESS